MTHTLKISSQHPSLPGHFPGQPVVPGVVILERIRSQLARTAPELGCKGIKKLKFLRPLAAEEPFTVSFAPVKNDGIRFTCHLVKDGSLLAEGHFSLQAFS